jgi:hypothetical protein
LSSLKAAGRLGLKGLGGGHVTPLDMISHMVGPSRDPLFIYFVLVRYSIVLQELTRGKWDG